MIAYVLLNILHYFLRQNGIQVTGVNMKGEELDQIEYDNTKILHL